MSNLATDANLTDLREKLASLKSESVDDNSFYEAFNTSQLMMVLNLDGTIVEVNENFLGRLGFTISDVKGKNHRQICEPFFVRSEEYRRLWERLGHGESVTIDYCGLTKAEGEMV